MIISRKSDDYEPVAWVGGYPIHVSGLLVLTHVLALVAVALLYAFRLAVYLDAFRFSSVAVLHGGLWRCITYAFLHSPASLQSLFNFAMEMGLLFFFGLEVERFVGRRAFALLYATLILVTPLLFVVLALLRPGGDWVWVGSVTIHLGILVAFAMLYPSAEIFFRLQARWVTLGLLVVLSIFCLAQRDWPFFLVLCVEVLTAAAFIARLRGWLELPKFRRVEVPGIRRGGTEGRFERSGSCGRKPETRHPDPIEAIDPLLDKIAREGMQSLTDEERKRLERAREELLRQGKR